MPVKDALGCDIGFDYSEDIVNIRDILDASIARRNIFIDSVELQKLTLEQVTYIHSYEEDAKVAIKWMEDLYNVMIKLHSHVGSNMCEIQTQKEELQTFQETAKVCLYFKICKSSCNSEICCTLYFTGHFQLWMSTVGGITHASTILQIGDIVQFRYVDAIATRLE